MFGFGFALVPFYKQICEATGINNLIKPDTVVNTQVDATRFVTIEFDSNLRSNLPWTFRPLQSSVRINPGEMVTVMYEIRNNSSRPVTGQAIPSYGPQAAGRYFKKLECFCFTQQTLQPGETRQMPVQFVIERSVPEDMNTITLSYSFFEIEGTARQSG
jgi:cytochrome c oxidase assembly protein subunit 11